MLSWSQVIKRVKLYLGLLICPDSWPNRSSFVKLEALFENKLSKKGPKKCIFCNFNSVKKFGPIWGLDPWNRWLRPGQPDYPIYRIRPDIRSNTDPKFRKPIQPGRVWFGPKTDPARPVDTPIRVSLISLLCERTISTSNNQKLLPIYFIAVNV